MNRRSALRAALVGLPLLALLFYAALNWYTVEEETIWVDAGDAAREDPYLAFTRLLDRLGARAVRARVPSALESLPPRGTLLLASRRLAYMTPERVSRIGSWVDRGGALVLEAEPEGIDDPLLHALGVQRVFPDPDETGRRKGTDARAYAGASAVLPIDWPQFGKTLRARLGTAYGGLRDARVRSDTRELRQGDRVVAMTFASGEGRVTVLPTFAFLRNVQVGEVDHAELGWRLASAQSPAVLYLRMQSPPLLEWVRRDAWPVALAGALLLLLWLARIIPRFGPLEPDPPPARRSLLEHIVASGRFLWARGAGTYLLEAVRERASRAARRRGIPAQPGAARPPAARLDATSFTATVASLQKLEERLARRDATTESRKEGRT